jgi:hypothetical protein
MPGRYLASGRPLRDSRRAALSLLFCLSSTVFAGIESNDLSGSYLQSLSRLRSFDVVSRVDILAFPDVENLKQQENTPVVIATETNRDVFAVNLGRRIERFVGDDILHDTGVIDWETAQSKGMHRNRALRKGLHGSTYYDYLNLEGGRTAREAGGTLSDFLRDPRSSVRSVDQQPRCLEISHPELSGPIRVWFDHEHGYLPRVIEWYQSRRNGDIGLRARMHVEEFIQIDADLWAPFKATMMSMAPSGSTAGRANQGFSMTVVPEQSCWNCINTGELFHPDSLPTVNHEDRGWKFYYPPAVLPGVKAAAENRRKLRSRINSTGSIAVFVFLILLPLAPIIAARARRKKNG